jgi:hypothetical protein
VSPYPTTRRDLLDEDSEPANGGGLLDAVTGLLDAVNDMARERAARVAVAAQREADRLEARLRRVALMTGACIGAGVLLVIGISGALGEVAGRTWVGQLAAGVIVLLAVIGWGAWTRWSGRRKAAKADAIDDDAPQLLAEAGRSLPLLGMAGAAGWVAGLFLSHRKGRRR